MENTSQKLTVAIAGNPNVGKTSIFNYLTGSRQNVGNWPGVTVDKKSGSFDENGYHIEVIDLPGSYSLTPNSKDEQVVLDFLLESPPDVIINVVDAGNLERNLYLTVQLLELGIDVILALNMWDEAEKTGMKVNIEKLSELFGVPCVITNGNKGKGISELRTNIIKLVEDKAALHRHIPIVYGSQLENHIIELTEILNKYDYSLPKVPLRWIAARLLENEYPAKELLAKVPDISPELTRIKLHIHMVANENPSNMLIEGRHGFIKGALLEIISKPLISRMKYSNRIDKILLNKWLGYPMFLFLMWLLFQLTFSLGAIPATWIGSLFSWLGNLFSTIISLSWLRDLVVNSIISGVGSVAVFIPNIMILFWGITYMEDSGYMARAAFIMDKVMHGLGLHGKSFIPMLMGFGCNVPAIMATRTLESKSDRILTNLLIPYMSCSARLPVYLLIAGALFPLIAGNIIFGLYIFGIIVAFLVGRLLRQTYFAKIAESFVLELPPYRIPTIKGSLIHMWDQTKIYVTKIGTVILLASVLVWLMTSIPLEKTENPIEGSFIGIVGKSIEPAFQPLGFDWQMTVSLISGLFAKEIVVSTLGVLYGVGEEDTQSFAAKINDPNTSMNKGVGLAFLIFVLLYPACISATIALRREVGTRWMVFSLVLQLVLAYGLGWIAFSIWGFFN